MKINFVYDILASDKAFPNGCDLKKLDSYWYVDSLNVIRDNDLCISDSLDNNENQIYFYPLSTSGNYDESLGQFPEIKKSLFSCISKKAIEIINNTKNVYVYYEHVGEPDFSSDILKRIYDECGEINLNIEKLLIVNGTNSNDLILEDFREKYGHLDDIKLLTYNWPIPFKSLELRGVLGIEENKDSKTSTIADISHIEKLKTKKALFLNRRLRYHRLLSLCFLAERDLLKDILYSFDIEQNMFDNIEYMIRNDEIQHNPIYISDLKNKEKILSGYKLLQKIGKNILDKSELSKVHGYGMETKELYEETFFSIISETTFSKFTQSFTEKILKPIQHFHPFVLIGSPFILKILKSYGFKTFDKWWDESYDLEEDDELRLLKVMELIYQLIDTDENKWYSMLNEMKEILVHNHNLLLSFNEEKLKEIISKNIKKIIKYNTKYVL